jgi:hypothetical protein
MSITKEEIEKARQANLVEARDVFPDLEERFGPGTMGAFEVADRLHVLGGTFDNYICDHAAILLNPEAYALADKISSELGELYQLMNQEGNQNASN